MQDTPVSWEEFYEELLKPQPWYSRAYWKVWRGVAKLRRIPSKVVHTVQRARRGWSDQDAWSLDMHLAHVIAGGVEQIRRNAIGYSPSACTTCPMDPRGWKVHAEDCDGADRWEEDLRAIVLGFQAYSEKERAGTPMLTPEEEAALSRVYDRGMELFALRFRDLWD